MDPSRTTVFISYSHKDRKWLERLQVHLGPLERAGLIDPWDDRRIKPGMQWREEIEKALRSARVAVLLVSADFMNSSYIQNNELPPLLEAAGRDGCRILTLIVEPCRYAREEALARFQAVNDPAKPLSSLRGPLREKILDNVSQQIEEAVATSFVSTRKAPQTEPRDWIARINRAFAGTVAIHRVVREEPRISIEGAATLSPEEREVAERFRAGFPARGFSNDPHAILSKSPVWSDNPVVFSVRTLDFGDVSALRHVGKQPAVLSGLALCFCEATQELLLHRRAEDSATYPGSLHILGGGYMPPGVKARDDQYSLVNTARREVLEEAQVVFAWEAMPPGALATELTTGFVQFVLLGVNLSRYDIERATPNREGSGLTRVAFDELFESLVRTDSDDPIASHVGWVPSGKAHVLAWLALGAPGSKSPLRFGPYSATELFEAVMAERRE
jgi:hypothetical protein